MLGAPGFCPDIFQRIFRFPVTISSLTFNRAKPHDHKARLPGSGRWDNRILGIQAATLQRPKWRAPRIKMQRLSGSHHSCLTTRCDAAHRFRLNSHNFCCGSFSTFRTRAELVWCISIIGSAEHTQTLRRRAKSGHILFLVLANLTDTRSDRHF
jgi:hypothetical protein